MTYSAIAVANVFIRLADKENKKLTNMQIQKLVYIAHGFCLAMLDEPLFYNDIKAFQFGPVIPTLYKKLSEYGAKPIDCEIQTDDEAVKDEKKLAVIEGVWNSYGKRTAANLSNITHQKETPWSKTWEYKHFEQIPNELIKEHYHQLINERTQNSKN